MHEAIAVWDTSITHQDHELMDRLGILRKIIPEHGAIIGMGQVSGGMTLLGVDEVRELGWVSEKEDWSVVGDNVPVPFVGPHLDRETPGVSGKIVRTRLATNG
jgi:hypothetical protein